VIFTFTESPGSGFLQSSPRLQDRIPAVHVFQNTIFQLICYRTVCYIRLKVNTADHQLSSYPGFEIIKPACGFQTMYRLLNQRSKFRGKPLMIIACECDIGSPLPVTVEFSREFLKYGLFGLHKISVYEVPVRLSRQYSRIILENQLPHHLLCPSSLSRSKVKY
jgi:hypothetical protein